MKVVLQVAIAMLIFATNAPPGASDSCTASSFGGFDSRLSAEPVARIPLDQQVVGFELFHGRPLVAFPHRLLVADGRRLESLSSLDPIVGISVDEKDRLMVQTNRALLRNASTGRLLPPEDKWGPIRGRLVNSGNDLFLDTLSDPSGFSIFLRRKDGKALPLISQNQPLRTVAWSQLGLALVYGSSLLVWPDGSKQATVLATDSGLAYATGACLTSNNSAVVSVGNMTILMSRDSRLVLVGLQSRCLWSGHDLYLLDLKTGVVWKVQSLEQLGSRTLDMKYANNLIKNLTTESFDADPRFREAARIMGCKAAREALLKIAR